MVSADSIAPLAAEIWIPCTHGLIASTSSLAMASPSAAAVPAASARRMRSITAGGTRTPGTSLAMYSACRRLSSGMIPATISAQGKPLASYEAPEMMAALMPAWRPLDPELGEALQQKLHAGYRAGIWSDGTSYYIQNWAWFGTALYDGYLAPLRALQP